MNPVDVMIGLFLAVCGLIIGRTASECVESYNNRKKLQYEWEKRKQRDMDNE